MPIESVIRHNGKDDDTALTRVEALQGAEPGAPEGDELDVLIIFAGAYFSEGSREDAKPQRKAINNRQ